ncbi:MAG: energy-coupling factor transporter ATPase [Clostridia bacterium]|nr:energy-coupling factor transporter ATPase [Clostridia bacterium]
MSIEVKHLTHVYMPGSPFEVKALDDVNLTIKDGEFIGIIGHTGSGKSTLISHFNALEKSEPGHVFVNGMDLGDKDTKLTDVRRAVGLVFQYPEYQLFEETVEKDIAFGPQNLKLDEKEIKHRVTEAMLLVGLDDSLRKASPFNLSGGQKRRVAIAGVLAMNPSILVLDEPAAGLDPAGRRSMLELIRGIHESGVTVVMVSHSMDDVGKYCDRLYVLDHGRIEYQGTPAEVFEHGEELKKIGLDVPECAKLAAVLREKGFDIAPGTFRREDMCREILKNLKK